MGIRVLIADDHTIMLAGLRSLLEKQTDFDVVAEAENGRKAVQMAQEKKPDVVVMDVSMPDLNGIEATKQIIESLPETRVIALSMHSDKRFVLRVTGTCHCHSPGRRGQKVLEPRDSRGCHRRLSAGSPVR
jgi:DNA-binding NarL/FixJ family response regulator